MKNNYSEDGLVEQPAIKLFKEELNYKFMNCMNETFNDHNTKGSLGRNNKSEVVLVDKLKPILKKLNNLPEDAINQAIEELTKDRSRLSMIKANQQIYKLIKNGVKVKTKINNKQETKTVKIINFNNPENNDFFLASQFWITGEMHKRRPDLILFINGLPLVLIELKATGINLKQAYDNNLTDYKDTIPQIFHYNAFIILSNGLESRIGTLSSGYEHFSTWKKIKFEKEKGNTYLNTILKGTCNKTTLLDLLENFTLFASLNNKSIKILAKNHQYLGVNNAIDSFKNRKTNQGKLGVFWHTQGSGKSFSMIFFTQKILRKFEGNYTFVIVTDRKELDSQIYQNFADAGVVTEEHIQATSGNNLKQLLSEDHRMIFTLIHKFKTEKGKTYEKITDRDDIIVITDEAHRSQYDTLALNMRNALPNASFIGFTGTPLIAGEEKTKNTFGTYVSKYTFTDSINDKATVPLYYDNRVPELKIINPTLNKDIYEVIEDAELDEKEEEKLKKRLGSSYDIITRDDRLNVIAEDIVKNFINRGYQGKAMVVSIDKFTTVRMYDKVKFYLQKEIENLTKQLRNAPYGTKTSEIRAKIKELKALDMAVIISNEQNEIKKFKEKGLDITKHRKRMLEEDLAEKFKDPKDNFKLVFVCNMWMTGFDAPAVSTIYLDKPMKNHTLMQAIARANRVFKEKQAGFIVDYINVFRNLKKALAIYATPSDGESVELPIQAKEKLVESLREFIMEINSFLKKQKIDYEAIIQAEGMSKYPLLEDAISKIVAKDKTKKNFMTKAGNAVKIYKAILPHKSASEFNNFISLYNELIKEIRSLDPEIDIDKVMSNIQNILDTSIASKGYVIKEKNKQKTIDISKINFEALKKQFEKKRDNAQLERLKNILSFKLKELVSLNNTRIDFLRKFQELVDDYNSGSLNNEEFFKKLMKFYKTVSEEEKRHLKEELTEEELVLFDKLKKPKLSKKELKQVKIAAKDLLKTLKSKLNRINEWRKKPQTRETIRVTIEKELDEKLPASYDRQEFSEKCNLIFQHIYDNYFGEGASIYTNEV